MGSCLEFGFWFSGKSDNDALSSVADGLVGLGATIRPEVQVLGDDVAAEFRSITDGSRMLVDLGTADGGVGELLAGDHRVAWMEFDGVVGYTPESVRLRLSYTQTPAKQHPVVVLLDDEIRWHPAPVSPVAVGVEVRRVFEKLCHRLDPSYAGIFVEFGIPEPAATAGNGYMFRDAYFSRAFLLPGDVADIEESLELETSTDSSADLGLWVFSTAAFGQVHCSLPEGYGRQVERPIARASDSYGR